MKIRPHLLLSAFAFLSFAGCEERPATSPSATPTPTPATAIEHANPTAREMAEAARATAAEAARRVGEATREAADDVRARLHEATAPTASPTPTPIATP